MQKFVVEVLHIFFDHQIGRMFVMFGILGGDSLQGLGGVLWSIGKKVVY